MHTFLYARVSTTDQTISHQRAQAEAAGFKFDEVIEDAGVSGVTTKFKDRKGGAKLLDKLRRGDVLVVRWVDRLGRNYDDVTETIRTLMQRGVVVQDHHQRHDVRRGDQGPHPDGREGRPHRVHGGHRAGPGRGHQGGPDGRHQGRQGRRGTRRRSTGAGSPPSTSSSCTARTNCCRWG